jgi:hypothetical protein
MKNPDARSSRASNPDDRYCPPSILVATTNVGTSVCRVLLVSSLLLSIAATSSFSQPPVSRDVDEGELRALTEALRAQRSLVREPEESELWQAPAFKPAGKTFGELLAEGYRVVGYAENEYSDEGRTRYQHTVSYVLQHPARNDLYRCVSEYTRLPPIPQEAEPRLTRTFNCGRAIMPGEER